MMILQEFFVFKIIVMCCVYAIKNPRVPIWQAGDILGLLDTAAFRSTVPLAFRIGIAVVIVVAIFPVGAGSWVRTCNACE